MRMMMTKILDGKHASINGHFGRMWPKLLSPKDSRFRDRSCHKTKLRKKKESEAKKKPNIASKE